LNINIFDKIEGLITCTWSCWTSVVASRDHVLMMLIKDAWTVEKFVMFHYFFFLLI